MVQPINRLILARLGAATLAAACLLTGLTAAGCSNHSASAQSTQANSGAPGPGGPGAGPRGNQRFAQVLESLGLSDDQKNQIRTLMSDARAQAKTQTDPQQRRATLRAAFQKIGDILTPAQRDAFKAKMQAMRAANRANGAGGGGGNPPQGTQQ